MKGNTMQKFKIALLQMTSHGNDQDANLAKGIEFCRKAGTQDADLALFPEMWNIGYTPYLPETMEVNFDPHHPKYGEAIREWQAQAIDSDSAFIQQYRNLARELQMAIAVTYLEKWPKAPRNTVSIIDRHGEIVLTYAKVHTCDFSLEAACTGGTEFPVCSLDTPSGGILMGAMICYDREFPESARILMLNGAEIIITPNACGMEENRMGQFRARAYENMVGVALTNYAAPQENGNSVAFSPIAFDQDQGSLDTTIIRADGKEGIHLAEFNMAQLRDYRQREAWGDAFRKPRTYNKLISREVNDPFIRATARR